MTHSNTNPQSGQYLIHAHSHISRAVGAIACFQKVDSCFGLVRSHWHGITIRQQVGLKALCTLPFTAEAGAKHPLKHQLHTTHVGAGGLERMAVLPQHALRRWISLNCQSVCQ